MVKTLSVFKKNIISLPLRERKKGNGSEREIERVRVHKCFLLHVNAMPFALIPFVGIYMPPMNVRIQHKVHITIKIHTET